MKKIKFEENRIPTSIKKTHNFGKMCLFISTPLGRWFCRGPNKRGKKHLSVNYHATTKERNEERIKERKLKKCKMQGRTGAG